MARAGVSRARILRAAREEFGEHGFSGARVGRIASGAGVNKQLIFYYFGSKQGLYEKIVEDAATAAGREEKSDPGGPGQLRAALNQLYAFLSSHSEVVAALVERPGEQGPADTMRVTANELVSPISRAIAEGQGHGHFRDDADPELVAAQALTLCLGHLALRGVWAGSLATASEWTSATRDLLARGLAW